jgi:conjugative relaxase-like TrwC/TraI family protein
VLSLAKAAKDYYLRKLGQISPREDYYLRGGTATGVWRGSGAAELGLEGVVLAEGLVRLFEGEDPGTGELLGTQLREDGVAAWDVTFSADKSVSLLWAFGDEQTRKEVQAAFEEATSQAFGYLETVASSTRGARKTRVVDEHGHPVLNQNGTQKCRVETWPVPTSGYVAAAFTEYTSRADDPQLHTHVVIANKVKGVDGKWRSIDGRLLYRQQLAAGYLHEAVLRKELTERLGVRWQPVHNGMADIEGFTRHQIEAFSQRREQLEAWREEQGLSDTPAARQVAVLATRGPKSDHPLEELAVDWRRRAVEVGLTPERITRIVGRDRTITESDPGRLAKNLISPEGLTSRASTFGRAEVIREIAAALPEGGTGGEIEVLADSLLQQRDVVVMLPVGGAPGARLDQTDQAFDRPKVPSAMRRRDGRPFPGVTSERRYTTAELLATEQRVIERALRGSGRRWTAPRRLVEATLRRRPGLNEGQREMVRRFATSGTGIDVGVGPAGSGKTAVMAVLAELAAITGTPILGAALAARAATGLQTATSIPSSSLTALNHQIRNQKDGLPDGVVVVVDEASMVGTRPLAELSDQVEEAGGKLILIGDHHQLPEIEAGGLFHALVRRLPAVELIENLRQRQEWERTALAQLRDGSVDQAVEIYRHHRRLVVGQNRDDILSHAVDDWYHHVVETGDLADALLLAHDNKTVADLNELARSHIAASGALDGPVLQTADRVFQIGDRTLCLTNRSRLGVLNGDLATVVSVDPGQRSLTVRLDRDLETRELPDWYLGEGHLDYGYALTGHKAQGVTVGRTFAVIGGDTDREWAYVAMSRGRVANTAYMVCPEGVEQCTHLSHQPRGDPLEVAKSGLHRSRRQSAAIEFGVGPP